MLLRTIVTIALLCALLEPAVRAAHSAAQVTLRARARIVTGAQTELAIERARRALARWVASGNDGELPPGVALTMKCALRDAKGCEVDANAVVTW
ncbi:MAG TPA: hypothetical protein VGF18_05160, partial [Candidatus Tumulicola sp.]